jgi:hypothetical protein
MYDLLMSSIPSVTLPSYNLVRILNVSIILPLIHLSFKVGIYWENHPMKYDFTAEYGPTTGRLGAVRNDEEELPIEPRQTQHKAT